MHPVEMIPMEKTDDGRGSRFTAPVRLWQFIGSVGELHVVTIQPGAMRGNHVHTATREAVIVETDDQWLLLYQMPGVPIVRNVMTESLILVLIPAGVAHAFVNTGGSKMRLHCFMDQPPDSKKPDVDRCQLITNIENGGSP